MFVFFSVASSCSSSFTTSGYSPSSSASVSSINSLTRRLLRNQTTSFEYSFAKRLSDESGEVWWWWWWWCFMNKVISISHSRLVLFKCRNSVRYGERLRWLYQWCCDCDQWLATDCHRWLTERIDYWLCSCTASHWPLTTDQPHHAHTTQTHTHTTQTHTHTHHTDTHTNTYKYTCMDTHTKSERGRVRWCVCVCVHVCLCVHACDRESYLIQFWTICDCHSLTFLCSYHSVLPK